MAVVPAYSSTMCSSPIGERDLGPPHLPRLRDKLGVGHGAVEVSVGGGGIHGATGQVGGVEAGALQFQGVALPAQEPTSVVRSSAWVGGSARGSASGSTNMSANLVDMRQSSAIRAGSTTGFPVLPSPRQRPHLGAFGARPGPCLAALVGGLPRGAVLESGESVTATLHEVLGG